jgi:polyisoprenoid-binding protein YceI
MNSGIPVWRLLLIILLLSSGFTKVVAADKFCTPFLNGKVKQSVLDTMLHAAKKGYLYRVQPATSVVKFCIDSKFSHVEGRFKDIEGGIAMQPGVEKRGQALLSIDVDSVSASNSLVEKVIKSGTFIDVERYPEILFVSTGFEWLIGTEGIVKGNLTLHGVTRPVTFNVKLSDIKGNKVGNSDMILIKMTAPISRADFGMSKRRLLVSDSVKLCMSVQAKRTNLSCMQCHND